MGYNYDDDDGSPQRVHKTELEGNRPARTHGDDGVMAMYDRPGQLTWVDDLAKEEARQPGEHIADWIDRIYKARHSHDAEVHRDLGGDMSASARATLPAKAEEHQQRTLPTTAAERKEVPIATGFLDFFPDAVAAVAAIATVAQKQHGLDRIRWDRTKSMDEADALMRHFLERGTTDTDGVRHSAKVAWRALALLQKEIEASRTV